MKTYLLSALIVLGINSAAVAQMVQSTTIDLLKPNPGFSFSAAEETTPTYRAYIKEDGSAYTSVSNLGGVLYFSSNKTASVGMAITNSSTGDDYLQWDLTRDQTAVAGEYFAQILITNALGSIQEASRGDLTIDESPGTTAINTWAWNSSNYATVAWVEAELAAISDTITDSVTTDEWQASNTLFQAGLDSLEADKVSASDWQSSNAVLAAAIEDAEGLAAMGGDISGASTSAVVVGIRTVPVAVLSPGADEDGYGLKYDHASGNLILGPVATEGTSISNILILSDTAIATDVPVTNVGVYRTVRPGNLSSLVVNAGGFEVAFFDLLGITLQAGTLHLLGSELEVNVAAYDGSVTAPSYTWAGGKGLGKYRFSYDGDYAEGYASQSNLVWYWAADGIHLGSGSALFGMNYSDLTNKPDLSVYAGTGTVAALDARMIAVEAWPTSSWLTAGDNVSDLANDAGYLTAPPETNTTTKKYTQDGVLYEVEGSGDYKWTAKLATTNGTGSAGHYSSQRTVGIGFPFVDTYFAQGDGIGGFYSKYTGSDNTREVWFSNGTNGAGRFKYASFGNINEVYFGTSTHAIKVESGNTSLKDTDITGTLLVNGTNVVTALKPQTSASDTSTAATPRWIGDELIIHTSTNKIYRAFGLTTNDWVQAWP